MPSRDGASNSKYGRSNRHTNNWLCNRLHSSSASNGRLFICVACVAGAGALVGFRAGAVRARLAAQRLVARPPHPARHTLASVKVGHAVDASHQTRTALPALLTSALVHRRALTVRTAPATARRQVLCKLRCWFRVNTHSQRDFDWWFLVAGILQWSALAAPTHSSVADQRRVGLLPLGRCEFGPPG